MLLISIIIAIILLAVLFGIFFFRKFIIIRINKRSMYPTLKHGQVYLVDRRINAEYIKGLVDKDVLKGKIFAIWGPTGQPIIKRLTYISQTPVPEFWVEGDNPDESMDSRQHGFLQAEGFIGELVPWRDVLKRLFRPL